MDKTYLQEAFHAMELLEEEDFRLDNTGVKEILDFQDHDELDDIVDVIDPEAETEEEIKDSYIGSVILECEVCHSPIFKNIEDVTIDEDSDLANIEDECPICHSQDGFKIIGQVAPYQEDAEIKVEVEDKECEDGECDLEDEVEDSEEEKEKNESLTEELDSALEDKINKETLKQMKIQTKIMQLDLEAKKAEVEDLPVEEVADAVEEIADAEVPEEAEEVVDELNCEDGECLEAEEETEEVLEEAAEDVADAKEAEDFIKKADDWSKEVGDGSEVKKADTKGLPDSYNESLEEDVLEEAKFKSLADAIEDELLEFSVGGESKNQWHFKPTKDGLRFDTYDLAAMTPAEENEFLRDGDDAIKIRSTDPEKLEWAKIVAGAYENAGYDVWFTENAKDPTLLYIIFKADAKINKELGYPDDSDVAAAKADLGMVEPEVEVAEESPVDEACCKEDFDAEKGEFTHDTKWEDIMKAAEVLAKAGKISDEQKKEILGEDWIHVENNQPGSGTIAKAKQALKNAGVKADKVMDDRELEGSLKEGFEKVDLEMEDKIIHVSEEAKEPIPDTEMITPVSDAVEAELMNDEPVEEEPIEDEAPIEEVPELDAPAEDIDYDVDDFDEEPFDELGEGYLKEVYDNVKTFNTSKVSLIGEKLVVEGMIEFNSGKSKPTKFIFEAKDATKAGKVRFIGENAQITRGKKAFTLAGTMENNKFIAESLNYNYRAKNADGQSTRLYGTIKR